MSEPINRQLVLIARPDMDVEPEHFEMCRSPLPTFETVQAPGRVQYSWESMSGIIALETKCVG
ncbi:hypothetical protein ACUSIJ_29315 [Pseudochelatococcus sp. B33]